MGTDSLQAKALSLERLSTSSSPHLPPRLGVMISDLKVGSIPFRSLLQEEQPV